MARRFSDIKRGTQLKAALDRYVDYLTTPRVPDINSRGARPAGVGGWVEPYGMDNEKVIVRVPADVARIPASYFTSARQSAISTAADPDAGVLVGFTAARMVTQNGARVVQVATSDITGQRYLKYTGLTRRSSPFGRAAAGDDQFDAFGALKAHALATLTGDIKRVSFTEESFTY